MIKYISALLCALLVLSALEPIKCRKSGGGGYSRGGGSHHYPSSHGLSGSGSGGSHSYPSSGGSHGYPSSGGSHGYPSSGGLSGSGSSHGYPSSGGLSGGGSKYPASSGGSGYPSSSGGLSGGGNKYPSSSGGHSYPSGGGLSGSGSHGYPSKPNYGGASGHTTINNHYHYNPPRQISYAAPGQRPVSYPVYQGTPPPIVYQYKNSGSKYGTLLAGLALLNVGTLAAGAAYAGAHSHSSSSSNYKPQPGEICKFAIRKSNGDYEETKIDCQMITSFIFQEEAKATRGGAANSTIVTTTVTNVTMVNTTNGDSATTTLPPPSVLYQMLPNGTLVPVNATVPSSSPLPAIMLPNGTLSSMTVTTTTTNTTVVNALDVKGKEVEVTPGIISVCWVAGAGVGLLPLFGWHATAPASGCYFVEVMDYNYLVFLYFATIVTPSVLMAAFYAHIYRVVLKQLSAVVTVDGSRGRLAGGTMLRVLGAAQKREVKATQNLAIIVFFFIICWIPLYTINAVKAFMPDLDIPNTLTYFCIIFSHLNSAINPLLYAYHLKDFRAALRGLICTLVGRGVVPIPAAYRPPVPMRRPALERCNALRERPRIYVHSPVWLRQREAEMAAAEQRNRPITTIPVVNDVEPFMNRLATDSSSGRHTPEGREDGPYLIHSNEERCQSPYKRVEDFLRRVRSANGDS